MYTGNTQEKTIKSGYRSVYPCVYREHGSMSAIKTYSERFIPVYTGNTAISWSKFFWSPVYPCVYREHYLKLLLLLYPFGLSLCIQGTQILAQWRVRAGRFIPVYTGNTYSGQHHSGQHPGLSLCIQGTPDADGNITLDLRFIPVYTGNTHRCLSAVIGQPVYPCVYREHHSN